MESRREFLETLGWAGYASHFPSLSRFIPSSSAAAVSFLIPLIQGITIPRLYEPLGITEGKGQRGARDLQTADGAGEVNLLASSYVA